MSLIKGFINSGECPGSKQEESLPGSIKQASHSVLTDVVWFGGIQLPGYAQLL